MIWTTVIVVAVALAVFLFKTKPQTEYRLVGVLKDFVSALPPELSVAQTSEIKATLKRYDQLAKSGRVDPRRRREILTMLQQHVDAGRVERGELAKIMAMLSQEIFGKEVDHPALKPDSLEQD